MDIQSLSHQLLDIIKEKHVALQKIYQLTYQQSEAIAKKQLNDFLSLSQDKQALIEKTNQLDELFNKHYELAKKSPIGSSFPQILSKHMDLKIMQETIKAIQEIAEKIKLMELQNKDAYKKMLLDMMVSLNQSMASKQDQITRYKRMNDYKKNKP
ncbi:MAG: hypothetical protein PWR27_1363 [Petroclostridium sp.]|jgi:hypothetical protein|uniref:flagellar export chaperone FlgN n=1 Tax=Petroclostridium xylanilyticum TaxID=1792311 RepID=UPI000B997A03|nr:flagellar export chaperone FlgN [Petroclostridium xylanilyticum]MBZ4645251.1 hypothetical protein [Clostridia bacterium]MDK2810654.1 hypothetical protein [Petroclostridium sp.]